MARPIATIDTSVLVSLQSAGLLGQAAVLFEQLLVPARVRAELEARGQANRAALSAIDDFAIFEPCEDYDPALVELLLDTRRNRKAAGRDQGEAEAVIQAAHRSANVVLVDDRLGREWARMHAIECHGAIWFCRELRRRGYLDNLRPYFDRMIRSGCRQPLKEMNNYLLEFDEAPLTPQDYAIVE